ncbi:MAG: efflux RND transporter permease subunit [Nitrospiraceae bacterium]
MKRAVRRGRNGSAEAGAHDGAGRESRFLLWRWRPAWGGSQRPLATVVIGGLFTSTILTLLVIPALYPTIRRDPGGACDGKPADPARPRAVSDIARYASNPP